MKTRRILLLSVVVVLIIALGAFLFRKQEAIQSVSAGEYGTIVLTNLGNIYAVGRNNAGQLATGTTSNVTTFTDVSNQFTMPSNDRILMIASGVSHTAFLTNSGRIWMSGRNDYGQFLQDAQSTNSKPIDITGRFSLQNNERFVWVLSSKYHLFAYTNQNRLFAWGRNNYGQLGSGSTVDLKTALDITEQFQLQSRETIKQVATSERHTVVLTSKGRIFTFGHNQYGQLGNDTLTSQHTPTEITNQVYLLEKETITQVSAALYTTTFLTSKGRVFAMGNTIGDGSAMNRKKPTEITSNLVLESKEKVSKVLSAGSQSMILTSTGRLLVFGTNTNGQLGTGNTTKVLVPTAIQDSLDLQANETIKFVEMGTLHSIVITSKNRVFAWGYNSFSQLGYSTGGSSVLSPTDVTNLFHPFKNTNPN